MLKYLLIIISVFVVLFLLYVLAVRGKKGHPGLQALRGWSYAHRGLHNEARPENSMAAFRAALEKGYGIELDIHLLKDGNLAVIHDHSLKRTAGVDIQIEDLTTDQLKDYHLEGTEETIPTFREVLDLFDGKAPLIVELKATGSTPGKLTETACQMLDQYKGVYCLESFDPRCIHWLKKHRPELIRGQLTENFFKAKKNPLPWILKLIMSKQLVNFLTVPHFVAYKFLDRKTLGNFLVRKLWGTQGVTWTLTSPQEHEAAIKEGWIPIFENYEP